MIEKRGNQWCVIHCHGEKKGQPIKCFATEAEAQRMHAAIEANKHAEDAVAWYEEFKAKRHDSTAVLMTPGAYSYKDGIKFKRKADIAEAVRNAPAFVPVYCAHDEQKLVGVAYNIRYADGKAVADIYHEHGLPAGAGVSPGFTTREVSCDEGICQTDMRIFHVAADPALEPRHDNNRVISGDSKMADDDATRLKTELDAKNAEIAAVKAERDKIAKDAAAFKAQLDAYEKRERETLLSSITSRLKKDAVVNLDAVGTEGLKTILACMDAQDTTRTDKRDPFVSSSEGSKPYVHKGIM
ncbi:MAG: hypothetical protein Q6365_022240 [Candidatus Sigynarchaeota archaeon]